jgi:hypothetical protein
MRKELGAYIHDRCCLGFGLLGFYTMFNIVFVPVLQRYT